MQLQALPGIGEVRPGDDLASIIIDALDGAGDDLAALQGIKSAPLLFDKDVPYDDYDELRLILDTTTPMANMISGP